MMRYDIEETAVYAKYVRWCGRTGSRGPSSPIDRGTSVPLSKAKASRRLKPTLLAVFGGSESDICRKEFMLSRRAA
jgi:hypothetical protein